MAKKTEVSKERLEALADEIEMSLNEMELLSWEYLDGDIEWSEDEDESDAEYKAIRENYRVEISVVPKKAE